MTFASSCSAFFFGSPVELRPAGEEAAAVLQFLLGVGHLRDEAFEVGEVVWLADDLSDFGDEGLELGEDGEVFGVGFEEELLVNAA